MEKAQYCDDSVNWGVGQIGVQILASLVVNSVIFAILLWSHGQNSCWLSEQGVLGGPIPQVEVLKVGALDFGSKSFATQTEAGSCEFPPDYMFCARSEYDGKPFLPISLSLGIFSFIQCVGVAHLCFWISFRRSCSVCSCRFGVFTGRDEFWKLLCLHLGPEPHFALS